MNLDPLMSTTAEFRAAVADVAHDPLVKGLEETIGRRDAVLAAVVHAASRFLGTANWDRDVCEVLARLGDATQVSRVYLFEGWHAEGCSLRVRVRHTWSAAGAASRVPPDDEIDLAAVGLGRWTALERGEAIHGPLDSMPASERAYFERIGARSVAAIPVFAGVSWWGYLGFADEASDRHWSRSVLDALDAAASTLGAAIYRQQAEAEQRRRATQLAEAQAMARMGSWDWDILNNDLTGSEEMYRLFGFEAGKPIGTSAILERVHPEDAAAVRDAIDRAVHHGIPFDLEHRIVLPSGDTRVIHAQGHAIANDHGERVRIVGLGQDVTEVKAAQQVARALADEQVARAAAEASHRRAAFLAEASRLLGSSFDYQTTLTTLTRLAVPTIGDYCTVDMVGADGNLERIAVSHVDPVKEPLLWELTRWLRRGAPIVEHLRRPLFDGQSMIVREFNDAALAKMQIDPDHGRIVQTILPRSCVCVPIMTGGKILGSLALYASESGRRFSADDLTLAEELATRAALAIENARLFHAAEQATSARDQMLGIVAHDLRNPLGTILMASGLLEEVIDAQAPARRHVAIVRRSVDRMNRLIGDLLDMKRIENGRLAVELRPISASALLGEAVEMLRGLAAASSIELALDAPSSLPQVMADANRIQQVLSNLIGNAIKFTPKGGRITLRGEEAMGGVRIAVADTGSGISAEQLPHVFGQFWQGSRTDKRGIGLGLTIAKGIVEAHGGKIWVASELGIGTTFYFTLQLGAASD